MLNPENFIKFTKLFQTDIENVMREYCQHLFLSYLYQQKGSERMLFKGGTALRVVCRSPRFSEDLDFTGIAISHRQIEVIVISTIEMIKNTGIPVISRESKPTTGGYLGIVEFQINGTTLCIQIEVSLRNTKKIVGSRAVIISEYLPPYTLVHIPIRELIEGKIAALTARRKPRDFYDYYFLLSGDFPVVREGKTIALVLSLLHSTKINFRFELKKFLPASHANLLRDFKKILEQKLMHYQS